MLNETQREKAWKIAEQNTIRNEDGLTVISKNEWVLNDEQIKKILETKPIEIKNTDISFDIQLSKEERIKHAAKILETWKKNNNR